MSGGQAYVADLTATVLRPISVTCVACADTFRPCLDTTPSRESYRFSEHHHEPGLRSRTRLVRRYCGT